MQAANKETTWRYNLIFLITPLLFLVLLVLTHTKEEPYFSFVVTTCISSCISLVLAFNSLLVREHAPCFAYYLLILFAANVVGILASFHMMGRDVVDLDSKEAIYYFLDSDAPQTFWMDVGFSTGMIVSQTINYSLLFTDAFTIHDGLQNVLHLITIYFFYATGYYVVIFPAICLFFLYDVISLARRFAVLSDSLVYSITSEQYLYAYHFLNFIVMPAGCIWLLSLRQASFYRYFGLSYDPILIIYSILYISFLIYRCRSLGRHIAEYKISLSIEHDKKE